MRRRQRAVRPVDARTGLFIVALAVLVGFAVWRIVSLALSDLHQASDPRQSLRWRDNQADALIALAEQEVASGHFDAAAVLARRALAANPFDGRGYRVLADVAAANGDRAAQARLIDLAVRHAPRDIPARTWAAQIALQRGDAAAALHHYDRLLRVAPSTQPTVIPAIVQLASMPGAREAVVAELSGQPYWRPEFLRQFARLAPSSDDLAPIFGALEQGGGLNEEEMALYLGRLVRDRRWDDAFLAWVGTLAPEELARLATPYDGGFENRSRSGSPFDWSIRPPEGIEVAVRPSPEGRGHALWLEFLGRRAAFRDVRQLLRLQPGQSYVLQWRSRLEELQAARGLQWTVTCADGRGEPLLATAPQAGSSGWRVQQVRFAVPDDCGAEWLTLELEARIPAESQAFGSAWFDDVRVVQLPMSAPRASVATVVH